MPFNRTSSDKHYCIEPRTALHPAQLLEQLILGMEKHTPDLQQFVFRPEEHKPCIQAALAGKEQFSW